MPVVGSTSTPSWPAPAPSIRRPSSARSSPSSRRSCGSCSSTPRASCASATGCRSRPWSRTPARELWRAILADRDADPDGDFKRDRFLASLDPTLEALARTLYARADPEPETEEALDQAVEQCLMSLERRRLIELFDFKRAELAEAEAATDTATRDRVQHEILVLQRERAELDRRLDTETLLSKTSRRTAASTP